ncbi:MAG TPA: sulfatase-like hydrolase/transferase, partial [Abditibacteriaceae bacterium]|nr:sulfatase-like hydrolase/transferase [Abditibacteriaceae bacterium]
LHYQPGESFGTPTLEEATATAPEYYEAFLADMNLRVPDDYAYVLAQYDGEISFADAQIGRITNHLKGRDLWDNTIVLLTSDHGECFGEGGVYFDHHGLYDAVVRLAFLWRAPGARPARSDAMISNEDVLPTLAEVCGLELPEYALTGRSFASVLRGQYSGGRDCIIGIESTRQASICIRTEKWKLIQPIVQDINGRPLPDVYGRPRDPAPLLFDLQNDPAERRDVGAQHAAVLHELAQRLTRWRAAEVTRRGGSDPLLENGLSLGYEEFMTRLNERKLRG